VVMTGLTLGYGWFTFFQPPAVFALATHSYWQDHAANSYCDFMHVHLCACMRVSCICVGPTTLERLLLWARDILTDSKEFSALKQIEWWTYQLLSSLYFK
jgi:hypothetical protein